MAGQTKLTIYNVLGEEVMTLLDKFLPAGSYSVEWDGTDDSGNDCASGVYLYKLTSGDQTRSRKMVLVR
jgi:flagellar hook assembly protein FlgD